MHKTTYLLLFLAFINFNVYSQNEEYNNNYIDNFRFGGGFNIGLGNSYSTFSISPSVIYDFSEEFGAGLGLTYVYVKNKSTIQTTTNLFGGSILTFYKPIHYLQLFFPHTTLNYFLNYSCCSFIFASKVYQDSFLLQVSPTSVYQLLKG